MKKLSEMNANYPIIIVAIAIWAGIIMFWFWWTGGIDTGTSNTTLTEEEQEFQKTKEETDMIKEEEDRIIAENKEKEREENDEKNNAIEKANDTYQVGKPFNDGIIRIELLNYDGDFKDIDNYSDVKKSDRMIRAEFEIEYIKPSKILGDSMSVSTYDFNCYADDYIADDLHVHENNSIYNSLVSGNLTVGKKVKGSIYFLVPRDSKEIFINYNERRIYKYIKFKVEWKSF